MKSELYTASSVASTAPSNTPETSSFASSEVVRRFAFHARRTSRAVENAIA